MAAPLPFAVLTDFLYCLGIGVALALFRDAMGLLFGEGRLRTFCMDVLAFAVAAVAVFGYAAGASAGGLARWYMAGAAGFGALAWHTVGTPALQWAAAALQKALLLPYQWMVGIIGLATRQIQPKIAILLPKKKRKNGKIERKDKKMLQNREQMLYN